MVYNGTPARAEAIASWVLAEGAGDTASLERVAGRIVVLILQSSKPDALWVAPGEHLVLDRRHPSRWRAYGAVEFRTCFTPLVRELPIFNDGEVAS